MHTGIAKKSPNTPAFNSGEHQPVYRVTGNCTLRRSSEPDMGAKINRPCQYK
jgi:hypothetical protein